MNLYSDANNYIRSGTLDSKKEVCKNFLMFNESEVHVLSA